MILYYNCNIKRNTNYINIFCEVSLIEDNLLYDKTDASSIEAYASKLVGKTFKQVLKDYNHKNALIFEDLAKYYNNPRGKGSLGNLIEKYFFEYEPNNDSQPDFLEAEVELKVMPIEQKKDGTVRAGERLVIGMIPNNKPVPDNIYESHVLEKLRLILFVLYLRIKGIERIEYEIVASKLFSILSEIVKDDFEIIMSDFNHIIGKIKSGKAHELSEGETMYLGACTKGATAKASLQPQYYNPDIKAKRRAFSLKQGYMTYVINKYILGDLTTYESIVEDSESVTATEFEDIVIEKIHKYIGKTESQLRIELGVSANSKDIFSLLAFAMLGIKSNNAEEFVKSDTIVKSIRIEKGDTVKESMSFPTINFQEFATETWEDSYIYNFFSTKKFLFVIYKHNGIEYELKDAKFWNMPQQDLDFIGKEEWLSNQKVIQEGVIFKVKKNKVYNNLPKSSETKMLHLRPHAKKSAYLINGLRLGKGSLDSDADTLPNGDMMTKQSFWLNKGYVSESILNLNKKST